jgi:hypothetical protein
VLADVRLKNICLAVNGGTVTVVSSVGGGAITLASSGAGVVTSFAGATYTAETNLAAAASTSTYVTVVAVDRPNTDWAWSRSSSASPNAAYIISRPFATNMASIAFVLSGVLFGAWAVL